MTLTLDRVEVTWCAYPVEVYPHTKLDPNRKKISVDGRKYVCTYGWTDTPDFTKCIRTSPVNDLKLASEVELMYLVAWLCPDPLEGLTTGTFSAFGKKVIKMFYGRFAHVGKTLTDLQILGCELHRNAFGGRAPPGPAGGIAPQTS